MPKYKIWTSNISLRLKILCCA